MMVKPKDIDFLKADIGTVATAIVEGPVPETFKILNSRKDVEQISGVIGNRSMIGTIKPRMALLVLSSLHDNKATKWIGDIALFAPEFAGHALGILKERPGDIAAKGIHSIGVYNPALRNSVLNALLEREDYRIAADLVSFLYEKENIEGAALVLSKSFADAADKPQAIALRQIGHDIMKNTFGSLPGLLNAANSPEKISRLSDVLEKATMSDALPLSVEEMRHRLFVCARAVDDFSHKPV